MGAFLPAKTIVHFINHSGLNYSDLFVQLLQICFGLVYNFKINESQNSLLQDLPSLVLLPKTTDLYWSYSSNKCHKNPAGLIIIVIFSS